MVARSQSSSGRFGGRCLSRVAPLVVSASLLAACQHDAPTHDAPTTASATAASVAPSNAPPAPVAKRVFSASRKNCETSEVYADGATAGAVCIDDAERNGLTAVDLSDSWTPRVFAIDADTHDAPEYRTKYLELANSSNADLGLYGVAPSLSVIAARLVDKKRVSCDAAVDLPTIALAEISWSNAPDRRSATAALKAAATGASLKAIQAELVCAGLLKSSAASGVMNASTQNSLEAFRRRHMIVGTGLDGDTLHALALGGDELAFVALLRGLRERVAEAAGLLEDGSALEVKEQVVGRDLDLSRFTLSPRGELDNGAGDLVDLATDAAARELGWINPAAATAFLTSHEKSGLHTLHVAVKLPARPAYYSKAMDLRIEIDRGDVFYETPGAAAAEKSKLTAFHGPSFVVYAKDKDRSIPLMRWATTIGGWKKERTEDGELALKYKGSDVGDRVWRQIIAAPAWMPPDSTPETDLLHEAKDGTVGLKRDLIQPGFQNAYGLVMIIHDEPVVHGDKVTYVDHGIRTHGSVDYRSIQRGESHGCHRLYNQLALRLSGFLLEHRNYVRRGKMAAGYHHVLEYNGQSVDVDVPTRGYRYELDPPVIVRVLEGHIAGGAQKPLSSAIALKPSEPKKG